MWHVPLFHWAAQFSPCKFKGTVEKGHESREPNFKEAIIAIKSGNLSYRKVDIATEVGATIVEARFLRSY